ncbi:MAG: superoxide dismutase [Firmicutes bacterium]|nr:superoxide dismutase [Bacillota bacterium]
MAEQLSPKPLKFEELDGISKEQLKQHHDVLYVGYVNKTNEIRNKLENVDRSAANQTYSDLRELKSELSFALNGVKLHEWYFDNLGGKNQPTGKIAELINRDFGSFENYLADLKATGIAARGWVVTAYDLDSGKLFNYLCDAHNQGGIWNCIALLVLDTYEHAYFLDYGTKRPDYIDAFVRNIDWDEVNARIEKYHLS